MKMMLLAVMVGLLAGCAAPKLASRTDEFTKVRRDEVKHNLVQSALGSISMLITPLKVSQAGSSSTHLEITFNAPEPFVIKPGRSCALLLDGEPLWLVGSGSLNLRAGTFGGFTEESLYTMSREQMLRVAAARQVKLRLEGQARFYECKIPAANCKPFADFVTTFLPE